MNRRSFFKAFAAAPAAAVSAQEDPGYELYTDDNYYCPECLATLWTFYQRETGEFHIQHPEGEEIRCKNNGKHWRKKFSTAKVMEVENHG